MDWEPGDLAACYGGDAASRAVSLITASPLAPAGLRFGPSHLAIICLEADRPLWVESTTFCRRPCVVLSDHTNGAQAHPPADRIADYESSGGRVERYRLTEINSLSSGESALLSRILLEHIVKRRLPYDLRGALLSGTRALQLSRLFPAASLESLFCSELVAAVLMRLNRMNHANPTRFNPARLLRVLVRTGKYRRLDS